MSEEREEILELGMRSLERAQVGHSIAGRQEVHSHSTAHASRAEQVVGIGHSSNHRALVRCDGRASSRRCTGCAEVGGQWAFIALYVGGEEEPLAVLVDREAGGASKLMLPVNVGWIVK